MSAHAADAGRPGLSGAVLEVLPELMLIHDEDRILFANAACRRFLGVCCVEEIEGAALDSIIHPDAFDAGLERRRLLIRSGRTLRGVPLKLVGFDGEPRHVIADAHPLAFDGAKAVLVVAPAPPA